MNDYDFHNLKMSRLRYRNNFIWRACILAILFIVYQLGYFHQTIALFIFMLWFLITPRKGESL